MNENAIAKLAPTASQTHADACPLPAESSGPEKERTTDSECQRCAAAMELGSLPKLKLRGRRRVKRRWTGFVGGQRCWRGRKVVLPNGTVAELLRAHRNSALVLVRCGPQGQDQKLTLPCHSLNLFKMAAAVAMGRRKAGVEERRSTLKAEACRRNARMPARPGHRKRGRPRAKAPSWQKYVLKTSNELRADMTVDELLNLVIRESVELDAAIKTAAERDRQKLLRRSQPLRHD